MINLPITANKKFDETNCKTSNIVFGQVILNIIENLENLTKISSSEDVHKLHSILEDLFKQLPGSATPETLKQISPDLYIDWKEFARNEFTQILDLIVGKFNKSWPIVEDRLDGKLLELFTQTYNAEFIAASINLLVTACNKSEHFYIFDRILGSVLKNELVLFTVFVEASFNEDKKSYENSSDDLFKVLMSIPNKMANLSKGTASDIFLPEIFSKILLKNFVKAFYFLCETNSREGTDLFNIQFLSKTLSQILIHFNFDKQSTNLENTFKILTSFAENLKYKRFVNELLLHLNRNAILIASVMILKCSSNIQALLNDCIIVSEDWNYLLITKIPLMSYFKNEDIIKNLIMYISSVSDKETGDKNILYNLLEELLDVWSVKACILRTSFEQHLYITKLIILSVVSLTKFTNNPVTTEMRNRIQMKIFNGITHHLESTAKNLRYLGMITSEVVMNMLNERDLNEKLAYDYSSMDKEYLELVSNLRELPKNAFAVITDDGDTKTLYNNFFVDCYEVEETIKECRESLVCESKLDLQEMTGLKMLSENTTNSSLDSDDEFESYDMSNDTLIIQEKRPKYLIDLKNALIYTEDSDVFVSSMETCEKLINDQLANNDIKLGLEILSILVNLEQKFYLENFYELRFNSAVEACCIFPKECAQYLCNEFHSDTGKYSINKKVFMLDILSQAAKNLSKINNKLEDEKKVLKIDKTVKKLLRGKKEFDKNQFLAERIENKTKRYGQRNKPTRYEQINKFADNAGYFFYPLVYGFGRKQLTFYSNNNLKYDSDNILLVNFLQTITILMICSENCPIATKFAREIIQISTFLRFNPEPQIRIAALQLISSVLISVSKDILKNDFFDDLVEIRLWLQSCVEHNSVKSAEKNNECRQLATHVLSICLNILM